MSKEAYTGPGLYEILHYEGKTIIAWVETDHVPEMRNYLCFYEHEGDRGDRSAAMYILRRDYCHHVFVRRVS
jgi:hypothetical protein